MEILKERILQDGRALSETVLKVDSFLNHGVDARLMYEIGTYFKEYYKNHGITKIFTIESSGIAPTVMTAMQMELPMVTLKKQSSKILNGEVYQTTVHSFTKGTDYELTLSKNYISKDDNFDSKTDDYDLIFQMKTLMNEAYAQDIAGAKVGGIGIVIEKSFQPGRAILDEKGYDVYSLARIGKLGKGIIEFI